MTEERITAPEVSPIDAVPNASNASHPLLTCTNATAGGRCMMLAYNLLDPSDPRPDLDRLLTA